MPWCKRNILWNVSKLGSFLTGKSELGFNMYMWPYQLYKIISVQHSYSHTTDNWTDVESHESIYRCYIVCKIKIFSPSSIFRYMYVMFHNRIWPTKNMFDNWTMDSGRSLVHSWGWSCGPWQLKTMQIFVDTSQPFRKSYYSRSHGIRVLSDPWDVWSYCAKPVLDQALKSISEVKWTEYGG